MGSDGVTSNSAAAERAGTIHAREPAAKVGIWSTIAEATAIVFGMPLRLVRLCCLPMAIGTAVILLQEKLGPTYAAVATALRLTEVPFLLLLVPLERVDWIVSALCLQFFAVRWHQTALSGDTRIWPAAVFWPAYLRFNVYALIVFLLGFGGILAGVLLPASIDVYLGPGAMERRLLYLPLWMHVFNVVTFIFLILAGLVSRCALILPAAAAGKPMSVRMCNCGPLGWVTDKDGGYRYQSTHPVTGQPWPPLPEVLLALWRDVASGFPPPQACLINYYAGAARMGSHVDADEHGRDRDRDARQHTATDRWPDRSPGRTDRHRGLEIGRAHV